MFVVDASVACKCFVAEPGSDAAEALIASGAILLGPDLIAPEVCKVAWAKLRRGEITGEQARAMVEGLSDLLDEFVPSVQLISRALEIANALAHPAYDCCYLALAEQRGVPMITDDRRLLARLAATPWAKLGLKLGDGQARR
jgi:predicted nucleic acid-binding protein